MQGVYTITRTGRGSHETQQRSITIARRSHKSTYSVNVRLGITQSVRAVALDRSAPSLLGRCGVCGLQVVGVCYGTAQHSNQENPPSPQHDDAHRVKLNLCMHAPGCDGRCGAPSSCMESWSATTTCISWELHTRAPRRRCSATAVLELLAAPASTAAADVSGAESLETATIQHA